MSRLLLVDDDANTLASLSRAFRLAGHEAVVCDTTRQLIDQRGAQFERGFTNLMADLAESGLIKGGYLHLAFEVAAIGRKVLAGAARHALAASDQAELLDLLNAKLTSGTAAEKRESARLLAATGYRRRADHGARCHDAASDPAAAARAGRGVRHLAVVRDP